MTGICCFFEILRRKRILIRFVSRQGEEGWRKQDGGPREWYPWPSGFLGGQCSSRSGGNYPTADGTSQCGGIRGIEFTRDDEEVLNVKMRGKNTSHDKLLLLWVAKGLFSIT